MLLLFDIDGTLVFGATSTHSEALRRALHVVHGVDPTNLHEPDPGGRTDGEIARRLLLAAGISAERIDERAAAVREECCRLYARLAGSEDLRATVLPGVPELLDWLSDREGVVLGLVTGNFEPVARVKLRQAGIGHYFPPHIGGFGSDSEDRAALPQIARRRAGTRGAPYPREDTIVIGDTPQDIACARADGVRCIAVSTGRFGAEELRGADWVLEDMRALRSPLETLLGSR